MGNTEVFQIKGVTKKVECIQNCGFECFGRSELYFPKILEVFEKADLWQILI